MCKEVAECKYCDEIWVGEESFGLAIDHCKDIKHRVIYYGEI